MFPGTLATASHLTCLKQPHFRHDIISGCKTCPNELAQKRPKKKQKEKARQAACGQASAGLVPAVSHPQSSSSPEEAQADSAVKLAHDAPRSFLRETAATSGERFKHPGEPIITLRCCLTFHKDNVGHGAHPRTLTRTHANTKTVTRAKQAGRRRHQFATPYPI